jgi:hypothetical protein
MRERLERIWPSLVALVGTVAVVLALLAFFGGDVEDSGPDELPVGDEAPVETTPAEAPAETPPAETPPAEQAETEPPEETGSEPVVAPEDVREPVGVLNQTSVGGLAAEARERFEDGGWEVPATGDWNGNVPETTVYYPEGMKESAEAFAAQFPEVGRIEPSFEGITQSRLVVILVDDYVEETGADR